MELYRCYTCGVKLVNTWDLKSHAGHQFRSPAIVRWYEKPKVWYWEMLLWLRKK